MQEAVSFLKTANHNIDELVNRLKTYVESHLGFWRDAANHDFRFYTAKWQTDMANMSSILTAASNSVNRIHLNFQNNEQNNRKYWT
jgi:uncharacterized protein YukE